MLDFLRGKKVIGCLLHNSGRLPGITIPVYLVRYNCIFNYILMYIQLQFINKLSYEHLIVITFSTLKRNRLGCKSFPALLKRHSTGPGDTEQHSESLAKGGISLVYFSICS